MCRCNFFSVDDCITVSLPNGNVQKVHFLHNGDILKIISFNSEGEIDGECKEFEADNILKDIYHYKNGKKSGFYIEYKNAKIVDSGNYENGHRVSWRKVYWGDENIKMVAQYIYDEKMEKSIVNQVINFDSLGVIDARNSSFFKVGLIDKSNLDTAKIRVQLYHDSEKSDISQIKLYISRNEDESYVIDFDSQKKDILIVNVNSVDSLKVWGRIEKKVYLEDKDYTIETLQWFKMNLNEIPLFDKVYPKTEFEPIETYDTLKIYSF